MNDWTEAARTAFAPIAAVSGDDTDIGFVNEFHCNREPSELGRAASNRAAVCGRVTDQAACEEDFRGPFSSADLTAPITRSTSALVTMKCGVKRSELVPP